MIPQEFLAEHVVEDALGEDFDSRALEGRLVSLLQLATLSITTEHAYFSVPERTDRARSKNERMKTSRNRRRPEARCTC